MTGKDFVLGIIPARAGSKRLEGKNLRLLAGKPMIAHTIEAALKSGVIDLLAVSTDSEEIAEASRRFGASVPFMRPKRLAADKSCVYDAMRHAVKKAESFAGRKADVIVMLQPTSPLRKAAHIRKAVRLFLKGRPNSLFSVKKKGSKPKFFVCLREGRLCFAGKGCKSCGRVFELNGAIYIYDRETVFSGGSYPVGKKTVLFEMPAECSVDVDSIEEFKEAEKKLKKSK